MKSLLIAAALAVLSPVAHAQAKVDSGESIPQSSVNSYYGVLKADERIGKVFFVGALEGIVWHDLRINSDDENYRGFCVPDGMDKDAMFDEFNTYMKSLAVVDLKVPIALEMVLWLESDAKYTCSE